MENHKTNPEKPWGIDLNTFCLLMHLSILFFWPLSIIMWVTNKDNNAVIDSHGKNVANFLISYTIYYFVSIFLFFVLIGFVTIFIVAALFIIFTIIAAIKAGKGEIYKYPLTIEIIK
tara:strand:- start:106 stop:456 length:351 start_codon:yes stop_codon:yes gene_type:complete